ncbi:hypothetical protein NE237_029053 [Protea cynaroides]|uniref:Uncharacterized protein n=1 Tax=Protea cynaroides TaxID=273540 RepID=A0A9Q0GQG9_9MAGN|nr:hypothetical protein NE237_029053 [Protea cynaroides]
MDDFSFHSESNDSAVEDIIAQAMDESVLEQVASINCSGFTDSVLPTALETRFNKLKSFPVTNQKQKTGKTHLRSSNSMRKEEPKSLNPHIKIPTSPSSEATVDTLSQEQLQSSNKSEGSANSFSDEETVVPTSRKSSEKRSFKSKSKPKIGSTSSSPSASSESSEVLSPPPQKCWVWCSPKKVSRKKSKVSGRRKGKENRVEGLLLDTLDWSKDDELLSDLSMFSLKEQQKKLKKALKEEEKVAREAEKVVEWAKLAAARMNESVTSDVSSDDEIFNFTGKLATDCDQPVFKGCIERAVLILWKCFAWESISLPELCENYHVVVLAYGAESDRVLGVPGEDLSGIYSTREFVRWFNGHLDYSNLAPDLKSTDTTIILGSTEK